MPEVRSGIRAEVVHNKLSIFWRDGTFCRSTGQNTIYIYDLTTRKFTTEVIPTTVDVTFTAKVSICNCRPIDTGKEILHAMAVIAYQIVIIHGGKETVVEVELQE